MLKSEVENWGLVDYDEAHQRQLQRVQAVQEDPTRQFIVICSHNPVATMGRKTKEEDLFAWDGPRVEIQRGGRVTYHGPNQVVVYPILHLDQKREHLPTRDLHAYLRLLEQTITEVLSEFDIQSSSQPPEGFLEGKGEVEATGIWIGERKIASIGIGVKRWVTYHGLALNVSKDEKAFFGMNPCGFQNSVMTSMEEVLGKDIPKEKVIESFKRVLARLLSFA